MEIEIKHDYFQGRLEKTTIRFYGFKDEKTVSNALKYLPKNLSNHESGYTNKEWDPDDDDV